MILAIALLAHLLMSLLILSIPHLTHRQVLFGVVVPVDFRSSPEGRRAIRIFRRAVAIPALAGLLAIAQADMAWLVLVASLATILAGGVAFVWLHQSLRPFAVEPQPIRVFELSVQAERLPWFTWLGVVPPLLLVAVSLYLHAHWDNIPARYPVHWDLERNPNGWVDRSWRSVYAPLLFGFEMAIWFFGLALAIWYGSRRSEPLRKPMVGFFVAIQWAFALTMAGVGLGPLLHLPYWIEIGGMPIILVSVIYLLIKSKDSNGPLDPTPNEYWKGGMIYYNPNDAALFVNRRDGVGFTTNFGNPWSWVMLASIPVLIAIGVLVMS